ncbi:hypothetical protein DL546_009370 [Coniochaeta pulveracea]|uniref:EF-hand domain-containing protein n=1 Tax=Coniochaeta pulveracea TaxID=177199 RepID=A0A420YHV9_9PEZI|nr:hypothetical protein DL546_009370 [Coniochaeta pulveracea]
MLALNILFLSLAGAALGHGDHAHSEKPLVDENANWMTKHMAEEHHVSDFDAASFFALHDFDADARWEPAEIARTYGLEDESNAALSASRKTEIVRSILDPIDANKDGHISRDEFLDFLSGGGELPDVGSGPGHHGDDEYEYEIHHWEKYHDENTKLEDLTHPEDIAHFKKHEEMEEAEERLEAMQGQRVVEENIPSKFRRG